MEIGIIGLGRMGANIGRRLVAGGHRVVGLDPGPGVEALIKGAGIEYARSLTDLVASLSPPRVIWLMIPAGAAVQATLDEIAPLLVAGDTLIDGGNSYYKDSMRRGAELTAKKLCFVDCGTSGGIWGLKEGFGLMVGGDVEVVDRLTPIFSALAPAPDRGWARVGPVGAGHFTKMVHNGIEYGLMQAYAEGFSLLSHKVEFDLDLHKIAQVWRHGSVVRSWLLDLTADALARNPNLAGIAPYVDDSGEGRWTVFEAIDLNVPAPVISSALIERLRSRDKESFADRLLATMRNEFGGHAIVPKS